MTDILKSIIEESCSDQKIKSLRVENTWSIDRPTDRCNISSVFKGEA